MTARKISKKSVAKFKEFHDFDPKEVVALPVNRTIPRELVRVGDLVGVIYRSDKWDRKKKDYIHKFNRSDRPILASSPDGKRLFILGGSFRTKAEGIVG